MACFACEFDMEIDMASLSLGIIIGATIYRVISYFIDLEQVGSYIAEVEKRALIMLATTAEATSYIQSIKYNVMKDLNLPENTLKVTKNLDDYQFGKWKDAAVVALLEAYPDRHKNRARYVDWKSAMKLLDEIYKRDVLKSDN